MTDKLTDFTDTSDVSDAAIEWVKRRTGRSSSVTLQEIRDEVARGCPYDRAFITAARLIQAHRPELLVDPVDAIVRGELAKAWEENGMPNVAKSMRDGKNDTDTMFRAAKRLYLLGLEAGKAQGDDT